VRTSSRNLAVLLFDEVELWDVAAVMQVASMAGRHWNWRPFRLLPTSERAGWIETRSQIRLEASTTLADCPEPEVLFVPGGYGARRAAQNPTITAWCARLWPGLDTVLASGSGAAVLAAAGVLEDAEVAATSENIPWLSENFPSTRWVDTPKVVHSHAGKLLSVGNGHQSIELGIALVERCLGARLARTVRASLGLAEPTTRIEVGAVPLRVPGESSGSEPPRQG
jgi:transcriptional regulator GlxA family with amidase domain